VEFLYASLSSIFSMAAAASGKTKENSALQQQLARTQLSTELSARKRTELEGRLGELSQDHKRLSESSQEIERQLELTSGRLVGVESALDHKHVSATLHRSVIDEIKKAREVEESFEESGEGGGGDFKPLAGVSSDEGEGGGEGGGGGAGGKEKKGVAIARLRTKNKQLKEIVVRIGAEKKDAVSGLLAAEEARRAAERAAEEARGREAEARARADALERELAESRRETEESRRETAEKAGTLEEFVNALRDEKERAAADAGRMQAEMEARARELEEECEERVAEVEGELVKCKMEAAERMTSLEQNHHRVRMSLTPGKGGQRPEDV
jgi:DNA repair exonuclease SbcCD ATPase subunit